MDGKLRNMTAIYISQNGKMLLLYRVGSRVVGPGWCGIGGHFEKEELNDPWTCALRELEEETPFTRDMLQDLTFKYVTLRLKKGEIRQNYYFFATLNDNISVDLLSNEGNLAWVSITEILEKEMPLTAKFMLEHYFEIGQYDNKIYSGTTLEDRMVFTELREF